MQLSHFIPICKFKVSSYSISASSVLEFQEERILLFFFFFRLSSKYFMNTKWFGNMNSFILRMQLRRGERSKTVYNKKLRYVCYMHKKNPLDTLRNVSRLVSVFLHNQNWILEENVPPLKSSCYHIFPIFMILSCICWTYCTHSHAHSNTHSMHRTYIYKNIFSRKIARLKIILNHIKSNVEI